MGWGCGLLRNWLTKSTISIQRRVPRMPSTPGTWRATSARSAGEAAEAIRSWAGEFDFCQGAQHFVDSWRAEPMKPQVLTISTLALLGHTNAR